MPTALQLIVRAYKALTVVGTSSAVAPTAEQRQDGLDALNALLDSWSNENLSCYQVQDTNFQLQIGVSSYTVGAGGTISSIARPLQVIQARLTDGGGNNYQFNIRSRDWWNRIGNLSSIITSQIPTDMFYDPQYPLGVLAVWPWPLTNYTVYFDSYLPVANLSTLTHSLSMPIGYERAMVYNLAAEIATMQGIVNEVVPQVMEIASKSIAAVKRTNVGNREIISTYDGALVSHAYATYNPYADRPGGGSW